MSKVLFSLVALVLLGAAQPAAAQDATPENPANVDLEIYQMLQLGPELTPSLLSGAPVARNHCPANYCNIGKQECAAECAPRFGSGVCFHQFCEVFCYCSG